MTFQVLVACLLLLTPLETYALDFLYTTGDREATLRASGLLWLRHVNTRRTFTVLNDSYGDAYVTTPSGQKIELAAGKSMTMHGTYMRSFNPAAPWRPKADSPEGFARGSLSFTVNGVPGRANTGHDEAVYRFGCRSSVCAFLVSNNTTEIGDLIVQGGDSWDIRVGTTLSMGADADVRKASSLNVLEIFDGTGKRVWWNLSGYVNTESFNIGMDVDVQGELTSNESAGALRSWGTPLHMGTVIYKKGETGSRPGPAPYVKVTANYPDGDISLNSGGDWTPKHAVREWKNDDGSGWLGLRARTTLSKPGEYVGTMTLTLSTL